MHLPAYFTVETEEEKMAIVGIEEQLFPHHHHHNNVHGLSLRLKTLATIMLVLVVASTILLVAADLHMTKLLTLTSGFRHQGGQVVIIDILNNNSPRKNSIKAEPEPSTAASTTSTTTSTTTTTTPLVLVNDPVTEIIQARRRQQVDRGCKTFQKTSPYGEPGANNQLSDVASEDFNFASTNILVNEEHKFLVCTSPKVASTSWKKLFLALEPSSNFSSPQNIKDEDVYNEQTLKQLKTLNAYSKDEQRQILQKYVKIMWTRNPFERLISAYRSKFGTYNEYYAGRFGSDILRKFRPNASPEVIEAGRGVALSEFLAFVASEGQQYSDIHWTPQYKLCAPCLIPYDYFGTLENVEADSSYLLKKVTGRSDIKLPKPNHNGSIKPTPSSELIKDIPKRTLRVATHLYVSDFGILGYKTPTF